MSGLIHVNSLDSLVNYGVTEIAMAIGVFDGVHLGHQKLLHELFKIAHTSCAKPVVMTFFPHPRFVLKPHSSPKLLISPHKKLTLLESMGIEAVITLPFTKDFACLAPPEFIDKVLLSAGVKISAICVGKNWKFGAEGKGDVIFLAEYMQAKNVRCLAVEEVKLNGEIVSSTAIRRAVSTGLLEKAKKMLGRPYSIVGKVVHGKHIADTLLDAPTVNVDFEYGILPPNGVYAGVVIWENSKYLAAISVGTAPTFKQKHISGPPKLEAHIINFNRDIYGADIEVEFIEYIRPERFFASPDELRLQIKKDIYNITEHFSKNAV